MSKRLLQISMLVSVLLLASAAQASAEAHHEATVWTYAFPFINFAILLSVLFYFLKAPIKAMFSGRSSEIAQGVAEAQKHHAAAVQKFEDIQEKLKNADAEAKALLQSLKSSGTAEKDSVITAANQFAAQLKIETQNLIAQEVRKAQMTLRAETVNLAAELAQNELSKNLTPDVQSRLQNDFVNQLKNLKTEGGQA